MKKVMTIVGTRPELIRLSETIKLLDKLTNHCFVHTGQNFTPELHDQFFEDLDLRLPDYQLNKEGKSGFEFIGNMYISIDKIIEKEKPEVVLILGDTNSCLSSYVAKRKKIPVFHMEAGNRCYDENVPEETNRKVIDSLSEYLLPYTQRSRENLLIEGYHPSKIIVTGNPITEIIEKYKSSIGKRDIKKDYILVTLHRDENVTNKSNLENIVSALNEISKKYKVILSVHPKLEEMIKKFNIKFEKNIELSKPFNFKKFLNLEKFATCVLSDSGTVPEECCILKTPCVLLRTTTERPELLENNSMILSGITKEEILNSMEIAIKTDIGDIPNDYRDTNVSQKIVKLLLRHI
ncbi:MAG: UDP-N-acetylglucosamine 2-epimerase (non-hydrolyzing) [Candidatus Gracilibacteria bacterium]|nr:UDP-N-acetylglucosamine 2-epimerase (non-hydrolyzing) [Candidatus Gracilibacteria bacterium]